MYNSRYRDQVFDNNEERKTRFSSYQDLSHLLKRKGSAHPYSRSIQKESPFEFTNYTSQENQQKFSLMLNSNDIKLSTNANPQFFKESENKFYRSKPQTRVNSAIQSQSRSSFKRPTSAYRNTSLKIADFCSTLDILQHQVRTARQQIKLALNDKNKLSDSMQNELKKMKDIQSKEISGLAKKFKIKKQMDLQRKQQIRNDINNLWYSNENLKQTLFQMQQRVEKLEVQMGNHDHL